MKKTRAALKRYSALRDYKVLSNLTVKTEDGEHTFDNILVGNFGILTAVCFDKKGELYGNERDESFVLVGVKMDRTLVPNLIKKAQKDTAVIREILSKNKIYNIRVSNAIVIESSACKPTFSNPDNPVLTLSEFSKYLKTDKFENDYKADVDRIISALEASK
jgi:hypothetical protein